MSNLKKKEAIVSDIAEKFSESTSSVVVEYHGLSVAQITELRNSLREEDIEFKVYKNTMTRLAAEKAGYEEMVEYLVGPNAYAFGDDAVAPSRILADFAKKYRKLKFKTGIVNGNVVNVEQIQKLSKLPNKDGMLSMLVGMLQSPVRSFAHVIKAVGESMDTNSEEETADQAVAVEA